MQDKLTQLVAEYPYSIFYEQIRTSSFDPDPAPITMIKTDSFNEVYNYVIDEINKWKDADADNHYIINSDTEARKTGIVAEIEGKYYDIMIKITESNKLLPLFNKIYTKSPTIYDKLVIRELQIKRKSDKIITVEYEFPTSQNLFSVKKSKIAMRLTNFKDGYTYCGWQTIEEWFSEETDYVINDFSKLNDIIKHKKTTHLDKNDLTFDETKFEDIIIEFEFFKRVMVMAE